MKIKNITNKKVFIIVIGYSLVIIIGVLTYRYFLGPPILFYGNGLEIGLAPGVQIEEIRKAVPGNLSFIYGFIPQKNAYRLSFQNAESAEKN